MDRRPRVLKADDSAKFQYRRLKREQEGWDTLASLGATANALRYDGPLGPVFTGNTEDQRATVASGPHVPMSRVDWGPNSIFGLENKMLGNERLKKGIAGAIGQHQVVLRQPKQGLVRQSPLIHIVLPDRRYVLRRVALVSDALFSSDGVRVARFPRIVRKGWLAGGTDAIDVATVVLVLNAALRYELNLRL